MKNILIIVALLLPSILLSEYHVDTKNDKNLVKFISDAKLEKFEGTTQSIDGYMTAPSIDKLKGSELYFEVDLNTVDTGIGLRNRHMREDYLHTDKWRFTSYKGKIISAKKKGDGYLVEVDGELSIHGVKHEKKIQGYIKKSDGNKLNISSEFDIKLGDYDIEVPQLMFFKLSQDIELVVNFYTKKVK